MFLSMAIFSTFILLLTVITFKDKPPRPPGAVQTWSFIGQVERVYETNTKKALKILAGNRNYGFAMISCCIIILFTYMISTLTG